MSKSCPADDVRDLLADTIEIATEILYSLRGVQIPDGDDGYLWRWAFFYLILATDLGNSALALANGHDRTLLILRRIMFEHMVRLRFYRAHPVIARAHLDDFTPRAQLFWQRLGEDASKLILDPAFDEQNHDPAKRYRHFDQVLAAVFPKRSDDLYATYYTYPSALIHGDALASMDILELKPGGAWTVHVTSRRDNTDETLYNYVALFINLFIEATSQFGVGTDRATRLRERLDTVRVALGMQLDL